VTPTPERIAPELTERLPLDQLLPFAGNARRGGRALLAAISDTTAPATRANALGVYRFWRDSGYALGALIGGITATLTSLPTAVLLAAALTAASGLYCWATAGETHPRRPSARLR
jgi:predicted MFS family arabinose efflux permease